MNSCHAEPVEAQAEHHSCHAELVEARTHQRGFTLIEVLIAGALFLIVSFAFFEIVCHFAHSTARIAQQEHNRATLSQLIDKLESDQTSAESVFIPATDVFGKSNANAHEVDFYAKDGSNRPAYWAYYYDANAQTIRRYDYASPGVTPVPAGDTITVVSAFSASEHAISEMNAAGSPIYAPLLARVADYDVPLRPGITGGTRVVHIDLSTAGERVPIDLSAAAAPSGFTVVLNYTPKPASAKDLRTWPVAVAYGLNNTDVADATRMPQPFNVAMALNEMLGGGIAQAAGCHAIAYLDTAMTQPDTTAGPGGCYDGHIHAYEATGATATYLSQNQTCGPSILFGSWNPVSATGTQADLSIAGGSTSITSCGIAITDGQNVAPAAAHGLVTATVYACSPVLLAPVGGGAYCLWYGGVASGYIYQGGTYNSGKVWMYDVATSSGPNLNCADYASTGSCQWNANGAVGYCFQGTSPPAAPEVIANSLGFDCSAPYTGNPPAKPWPTKPCLGTVIQCRNAGSGGPPQP